MSVSGIGFHKNVPVKMEQKRCSWQTTIQFLPGTDEEEKREKNKRYEEHRPERKLNTKWQEGPVGMLTIKRFRIYIVMKIVVPIPFFSYNVVGFI